ncbi:hypothetical protein BX661DRAFT_184458 [Kickxella alabastrina]|uniref:uncharacterized protein n=1 Tax=Kickxella alabastrina TaxID=61397 RepID=UPI0022206BDA|nr:uncharacterized protein BX661DRAFT_184458 [Kickxella alabastrina]KAI7825959.1 hypothetical protein BX661DRAFT_184458 [Kickxella alabastrina]
MQLHISFYIISIISTLAAGQLPAIAKTPLARRQQKLKNYNDKYPTWHTDVQVYGEPEIYDTDFQKCKKAHDEHFLWLVNAAQTFANNDGQIHSAGSGNKLCSKCFCVPNTQRVGCVHIDCKEVAGG